MKCPRCGNQDPRYFAQMHGRIYCRKCIQFNRVFIDEDQREETNISQIHASYSLKFTLSKRQQEISDALVTNYERKVNTLVMAVCGSGKTEITYQVICHVINAGKRVCFALPRKALVEELYERMLQAIQGIAIGCLYGGKKINEDAPLIICTAHQLYRYCDKPFALLLMDEADAFPFYGDEVLNHIFHRCYSRCFIKMSATLVSSDIHQEDVLIMNRRYHQHDLPLPTIRRCPKICDWLLMKRIVHLFIQQGKVALIYVPRVEDLHYYQHKLKHVRSACVSSSTPHINQLIDKLRNHQLDVLFTTTILERGITVDDVQVIVMNASHPIFDERTLMQIEGRVGRSMEHYDGEVIFIAETISQEMKKCISTIHYLNNLSVSSATNR